MEILKLILSAAPKIISSIAGAVAMRRARREVARALKRKEAEDYQQAQAEKRRQEREAAKIRGLHKNDEYRGI